MARFGPFQFNSLFLFRKSPANRRGFFVSGHLFKRPDMALKRPEMDRENLIALRNLAFPESTKISAGAEKNLR